MPPTQDLRQSDRLHGELDESVPCIDFRRLPDDSDSVASMRRAVLDTGFFYVDHAFENPQIVASVLQQMQAFYSLADSNPLKQAVRADVGSGDRGWTPLYMEPAYQAGTVAHMESFDCGRRRALGNTASSNSWPDIPGFKDDVRLCWDALENAGDTLLAALASAAGIEPRYFADRCDTHELNTMRLIHYPGNGVPAAAKDVGISAHTDFECMTLIFQTAPGLELRDVRGNWYDAPRHDGRFVVLLGDMMERWTNGFFKATGHRVRSTSHSRYSVVMFFAVNDDESVGPLPHFVSAANPAKYEAISQREHLAREVDQAVQNRASSA